MRQTLPFLCMNTSKSEIRPLILSFYSEMDLKPTDKILSLFTRWTFSLSDTITGTKAKNDALTVHVSSILKNVQKVPIRKRARKDQVPN